MRKEEYVGETGRPLCIRIKEHLDGLRVITISTPLGEHRVRHHEGAHVDVAVSIFGPQARYRGTQNTRGDLDIS
ncbi:unnamed protein product [Nippostrongylus brasiliensis]|uniref:DnaJ_C domain-containing protein n=1 Tax=Nippostrongylus brasiliensis TaxID=27835 RepID=A0A0N4YEV9_NIPBR|nr:unnamed protein product [Nippostrongylus brasiliensis]